MVVNATKSEHFVTIIENLGFVSCQCHLQAAMTTAVMFFLVSQ